MWDPVFVPKEEMPNQIDCPHGGLRIKMAWRWDSGVRFAWGGMVALEVQRNCRSWWRIHWRGRNLMGSQLNAEEKQGNAADTKSKKRGCSEHSNFQIHGNALVFYELKHKCREWLWSPSCHSEIHTRWWVFKCNNPSAENLRVNMKIILRMGNFKGLEIAALNTFPQAQLQGVIQVRSN